MKYSTNDLSRILGVSGNTIRRFDAKGYLTGERNEDNGYRVFEYADLVKLMYVTKYRKEDFAHEVAAELMEGTVEDVLNHLEKRQAEIREKIAHLKAVDHLLKDDIALMKRARDNYGSFIEKECQSAHYVLYIERNRLVKDRERNRALQDFMEGCPEFYYFYLFDRKSIEEGRFEWSEGVGSNTIMTERYGVKPDSHIEEYTKKPCVVRFEKFPILSNAEWEKNERALWDEHFGTALDYIRNRGMHLAADVMGLKIGCFREEGQLFQFVLMHYPMEEA